MPVKSATAIWLLIADQGCVNTFAVPDGGCREQCEKQRFSDHHAGASSVAPRRRVRRNGPASANAAAAASRVRRSQTAHRWKCETLRRSYARALRGNALAKSLADWKRRLRGSSATNGADDRVASAGLTPVARTSIAGNRIADVFERDGHRRFTRVRQIAGEHSIENDAEAVEIRRLTDGVLLRLLG